MRTICKVASCVAFYALLLTQLAFAQDTIAAAETKRWAFGPTIGTLGVGAEASYFVNPFVVIRGGGAWLKFDYASLVKDYVKSNNYNFTANDTSFGASIDFHPFRNGFRVITGLRYADFRFSQSNGNLQSYTIGNNVYTAAQIGTLNSNVTIKNKAAGYLGIGWDSAHHSSIIIDKTTGQAEQFTISWEMGALYTGGVNVAMTTTQAVGVSASTLQSDIALEQSKVTSSFNRFYSFYPVAMVTAKYAF